MRRLTTYRKSGRLFILREIVIFQQQFTVPLRQELDGSRFSRLYIAPTIFMLPLDSRSRSTGLFSRMLAIVSETFCPCHGVYECVVFGRTVPGVVSGCNGRTDLR